MAAVAARQGIESGLVPAVATAFCSGLSETGGMCGALTGGILALSMSRGRRSTEHGREALYANTRALIRGFEEKFGATRCPDLIHIQLGAPEASEAYQTRGLSAQCEQFIREVTKRTAVMLQEEG